MKHQYTTGLRMPAEWEPCDAVMLSWPHEDTDWSYMLTEVCETCRSIISEASKYATIVLVGPKLPDLPDISNISYIELPTDDTWTRDYGPIASVETATGQILLNDFCFNGWGLKFAACHDNLVNSVLASKNVFSAPLINHLGFVLEGGSIESDGQGTLMTTRSCLLSPNRNGDLERNGIEAVLRETLGAKRVLWLSHGYLAGDDTDGHIDTLARFLTADTIAYVECNDPSDVHFSELMAMKAELESFRTSSGIPYKLVALPLPDPLYDPDDGSRLPATYANFLIINGCILLPTYGQPENDREAARILSEAMPGYKVIPIDCRSLVRQHGSLHCMTMQLPYKSIKQS